MKPIILLTGVNEVFKREHSDSLLRDIPKDEIVIYYADEQQSPKGPSIAQIIFNQCIQNSLFGGNNVVIVRNIDAAKKELKNEFINKLLNYIQSYNENTNLILEWEKPSEKVLKKFRGKKEFELSDFKKIYNKNKLLHYIRNKFIEAQIRFEEPALDLIVEITNEDISQISMLTKMLIDYGRDTGKIDYKDARTVLSRTHNLSIFDLIEALFVKDVKKAMYSLNDLKLMGEPIIKINFMILRSAKLLWGYLTMRNQPDLNKSLRISTFELNKMKNFAHHVNLKFVSKVFILIKKVEYISKSMIDDFAFLEVENFILTMKD